MPLLLHTPSLDGDCSECHGRRAFIRDAIGVAASLAGLSMFAPFAELAAIEPRVVGGVRYHIPAADGASIDKKNDIILCRRNGEVYAFALACPHQRAALKALPDSEGFQCPRHKSRFQTDGTLISGRAKRNMDRLPIARDGDEVVVDPDVAYASDKDAERWAAAVVKL